MSCSTTTGNREGSDLVKMDQQNVLLSCGQGKQVNEGFRGGGDGGGRTWVKGLGVVVTVEMQVGEGFRGGAWEVNEG
ncbi:hypothetical protein Tco_1417505 [Tanacetum coccineum]